MVSGCARAAAQTGTQVSFYAGRVFKGKEKSSGKHVVIKALKKQDILDEGVYRQLQREVETHCRLSHPNIVRMYAYFHDSQQCEFARHRPGAHQWGDTGNLSGLPPALPSQATSC